MHEEIQNLDSYKHRPIILRVKVQGSEALIEFCQIHSGKFSMNSNEVKIDQDFYLGKYPVTQQQWEAVTRNNPSYFNGGSLPVENVTYSDVQIFIQKLNSLSGKQNYRLPTEAEWEYACWAGFTSAYYFGDDASRLGEYAWYTDNSDHTTHPVGQKKSNELGLYDMVGNVWEWTDSWDRWYPDSNRPFGVLRGGSFISGAYHCSSADGYGSTPFIRAAILVSAWCSSGNQLAANSGFSFERE